jgi:hypothetical protein
MRLCTLKEALSYNSLVQSWPEITHVPHGKAVSPGAEQEVLFGNTQK